MDARAQCATCVYFVESDTVRSRGECREESPKVLAKDEEPRGVWPMVKRLDWCGKWALKATS